MTIHGAAVELFTGTDGWIFYLAVGLLAFGESAAFLGLAVPGELAVIAAGAAAAIGTAAFGPVVLVAIVGSVLGGLVGYGLGRRWGSDVLGWKPVRRRLGTAAPAVMQHLAAKGGLVVMLSRFNSITRALVPALAGTAGMPLRRFMVASAVGGVAWAGVLATAGFLAGASWRAISAGSTLVSMTAFVVVLGLALAVARRARRATGPVERSVVGAPRPS